METAPLNDIFEDIKYSLKLYHDIVADGELQKLLHANVSRFSL